MYWQYVLSSSVLAYWEFENLTDGMLSLTEVLHKFEALIPVSKSIESQPS